MSVIARKYDELRNRLSNLGSALVAYSGGVDSTLLAFAAHAMLGDRTIAVYAVSDVTPPWESDSARATARQLGLRLVETETYELADPRFQANPPDRCYYCKVEMFGLLGTIAKARGIDWVLDGTNADDMGDRRPGRLAAAEYGVISPLLEVGLHKDEIRTLAQQLGLPNWDKPSMACLASRFPYNTPITEAGLEQVARAEEAARALGLRQVRVRAHGSVARLEVDASEMERAFALRDQLSEALKQAGFSFVTQDLEGYRSGTFDQELAEDA